jgi:hypothetical protein
MMMMLLKIERNMTIDQVNHNLHTKFPYLKLVFFKQANNNEEDNSENRITALYTPLIDIYPNLRNALINLNGNLQVRNLETKINEITGARVQVFRRSGNVWLETLTTDNKTLADLNKIASNTLNKIDLTEPTDYQEQD